MGAEGSTQLSEQGIEGGVEFLFCGIEFRLGGMGVDEFFEGAGGGLDGFGADVAGDAFQGVSEAFGEGNVTLIEGGGDLGDDGALLVGKLAQEF